MQKLTHCKRDHEFTEENTYVTKNGIRHCKTCRREMMRERRDGTQVGQANSRKTQCAQGHPYDEENTIWSTKKDGRKRRNCKACAKTHQDRFRIVRYGITEEQYQQLVTLQENKCAICKREFVRTPHIDHDHTTGEVRGLLCYSCNGAIGNFKDNVKALQNAINYLEKFSNTDTQV
jgi:hypothetical protein